MDPLDHDTLLAEFKALRDESLRCAQLLSNAAWVAVTGYAVTIGAAAAFLGRSGAAGRSVREEMLLPATLALLCVEAMAISAMYLSELWKYIRVGAYIREHLALPTRWEKWIQSHRAYELYIGSLTFLQLPVLVAGLAVGLSITLRSAGIRADPGGFVEWTGWVTRDPWLMAVLVTVIALDTAVVAWLLWRVALATQGHFGWPRFPSRPTRPLEQRDQITSASEAGQ